MQAGFQAIGETGSYQVDSSFANLALDRSGVLTSQNYTNGSTQNTSPTRAQITLYDGEILALSCSVFCALGSRQGNTAFIYVAAAAGQQISYYIFKPGSLSVSTTGLQIFNENEQLTFDSGWKLFDVRSIMQGYSNLNLTTGKKYAFVHTQISTRVKYDRVVNGMPPNYFSFYIRVTEFSSYRINGGLVECSLQAIDVAATDPSSASGGTPGFSETWTNGATPSALIIDVTGY